MHLLREGTNIGWPYTYWDPIKQARMVAPEYGGDNRKRDDNPLFAKPVVAFPGHWAPLQMAYYAGTQFPAKFRGGMFVSFHGSWNRAPRSQAGYQVAFVPFDAKGVATGTYETFADGFAGVEEFTNTGAAKHRPAGLAVGPDGSLYVGDSVKGRLWRIIYTGENSGDLRSGKSGIVATSAPAALVDQDTPGGKIYAQLCAACHMLNGSGVPGMQPALIGSRVVAGDPALLIKVLLHGPAAVLPADREKYQNVMPALHAVYNDDELASVANYVRKNFAPGTNADLTPAHVAAQR